MAHYQVARVASDPSKPTARWYDYGDNADAARKQFAELCPDLDNGTARNVLLLKDGIVVAQANCEPAQVLPGLRITEV